jgi:tetratricopeptide (TPR) repeat protein
MLSGCSTVPRSDAFRTLRPLPTAPSDRADRAVLSAFFTASGIALTPAEVDEIIPARSPSGRLDRNALRRIARRHNRLVWVLQADETHLWEELKRNHPLLLYLPAPSPGRQTAALSIPLSWDRTTGRLTLLDGSGATYDLPASDFFARREEWKHAALRLVPPREFGRMRPTLEQKQLMADFWYHQGAYRRAAALYKQTEEESDSSAATVEALCGRGNSLVQQKRYTAAIALFRQALALEPDNADVLNNLAYALLCGNGGLMEALRYSTRAVEQAPGNPLFLETLGTLHLRLGDGETAARLLEQAWARALRHPDSVQRAIMEQLIRAWFAAGRTDLAWQVADHRRRTHPSHPLPKDIVASFPSLRNPPAPLE